MPAKFLVALCVVSSCLLPHAEAQIGIPRPVILSPSAVIDNTMGVYSATYPETAMIDQSGLASGFVSGVTDYTTYLAGNPTHQVNAGNLWYSNSRPPGTLDFDLGNTYSIQRLAFWNSGRGAGSNVDEFEVFTSTSPGFATLNSVGVFNASKFGDPAPAHDFDLTDSVGRYVRVAINSKHTGFGNVNVVGIGELAFAVSAVPEPSSVALLTLVLATVFTIEHRRRRYRRSANAA